MLSRIPAPTASCSSMADRRGFRCADESHLRPARRRSGSHDLQYALAPRADRIERTARQGRQDDHRAREHAAVAGDRRHLAVERAALQTPAEDRAAEQDLLHDRHAGRQAFVTGTSRMPRTPTATCTCISRQQNVLAVGDVVSGQGWPVVDWVTGGWIGGIVGGLQRLQTLANEETRIVPGRGPVLGLKDLKAQSEMYGTIYDRLTQLLNKGRGPGEAVEAKPTKEFDA